MMNSSTTVYLIDDEAAVRKALARLVSAAGHGVQTFDSARAFLEHVRDDARPACLVVDVQMPEVNGLDLQRELKNENAILPIIFISGRSDIPTSVHAMKSGATDFLTKPVDDEDLLSAIERAHSYAVEARRQKEERDAVRARIKALTAREREVMMLVVTGRLNKQIAGDLGTVEKTIKVHRARVMTKMQVHSVAALVRVVETAGVELPAAR
jgi:FixJ family two-component response regulator